MIFIAITLLSAALRLVNAAPPSIPGFTLTWSDDFNGIANSPPDTANWLIDTGTSHPNGPSNWGTGEIQTYTNHPDNLQLTGASTLQITPLCDTTTTNNWTSARIETQRSDFQALPGGKLRISARISMPNVTGDAAAGYWPAFWSMGAAYRGNYHNWPAVGEYDIMDNVNGLNRVWGVLHCGVNPGGPCRETAGLFGNVQCPGSPCQGNWHTYTVEVDRSVVPETLAWSVDDVVFHTVGETEVGAETWAQAVHHGHFLLLNVAVRGAFPDAEKGGKTPTAETVPGMAMFADWVAVYNSV